MKKILFVCSFLTLVLATTPIFANGSKESSSTSVPVLSDWVDTTGNTEQAQCVIAQADSAFSAANKGATIQGIPKPNGWDATRTAIAAGAGPDIVITPSPSYADALGASGKLVALDDYAAQLGWKDQFLPWALSLGKVNGKLYSLPDEIETMVLYYNKNVFSDHNWTPPTTMSDYLSLLASIKAAGLIPDAAGNADFRPTDGHFVTFFLNAVAGPDKIYQALTGKIPWTDDAFLKAITTLNQVMQAGYWEGGLSRYYTSKTEQIDAEFGDGKAATMIDGTWAIGGLGQYFGAKANNNNDWDWVPFPTAAGVPQNYPLGIGSTRSINAVSKYPKQAAEYLTYFFSPDTQARLLSQCGTEPPPVKLDPSNLTGLDPRYVRYVTELTKATGEGNYGYTNWTFWPPKTNTYMVQEIEKVWANTETPAQYLDGLEKVFQQELASGSAMPIPSR